MSEIPSIVRDYIRDEQRGIYTMLLAVVEAVDEETRRCEVSLKDDENALVDNIPIASSYAGDGYGEVVPISPGDEGILLCMKDPSEELFSDTGHQTVLKHRQHSFQDAVFFPRIWFDTQTVPDHQPGEYLLAHESGSLFHILPNGAIRLVHQSGNVIQMDENGVVTLGDPNTAEALAVQNHTHTVTLADGSERQTTTPNEPGTQSQID